MKYIRTKDGIYEVLTTYLDDWNNKSYRVIGGGAREYCEMYSEIIKKADTIEELIQDGDLCRLAKCEVCREQIAVVRVFPRNDYIAISVPGIEYGEDYVLELWIKDTKGNYIKVAQKETKEEKLKLL